MLSVAALEGVTSVGADGATSLSLEATLDLFFFADFDSVLTAGFWIAAAAIVKMGRDFEGFEGVGGGCATMTLEGALRRMCRI